MNTGLADTGNKQNTHNDDKLKINIFQYLAAWIALAHIL